MCDDMSDDSEPEVILAEKSWTKHIKDIKKDGYRQGLEVGQEEILQECFNQVFPVAARVLRSVAHLRGLISGKLSLNLLQPGFLTDEQETNLQELLQDVLDVETKVLAFPGSQFIDWSGNPDSSGTGDEVGNGSAVKNTCGGRQYDILNVAREEEDQIMEQMGDSNKSSGNAGQNNNTIANEKDPNIGQICLDVQDLLKINKTRCSPSSYTSDSGEQGINEQFTSPGKKSDLKPNFQQRDTEPGSSEHCGEELDGGRTELECFNADVETLRDKMNRIMSAVS